MPKVKAKTVKYGPFIVVYFTEDETVTYMNTTWLCGTAEKTVKNRKVYWPASGGRVDKKMLAGEFPGGTTGWTKLNVEVLSDAGKRKLSMSFEINI